MKGKPNPKLEALEDDFPKLVLEAEIDPRGGEAKEGEEELLQLRNGSIHLKRSNIPAPLPSQLTLSGAPTGNKSEGCHELNRVTS